MNRICYLFFEAPECGVGLQARFGEGGVQSGVRSGGVASSSVDGGGVRSGGGGGVFTSSWTAEAACMVDPAEEACGLESEAAASCAVGGGLEAVCGLDATASGSYSTIFFSKN